MKDELLRRLFEGSPASLLALDAEGRCVLCNPAAAAVFGVPVERLQGANLHELLRCHTGHDDCAIAAAARGESRSSVADAALRGDGSTMRAHLSARPLMSHGEVDAIALTVADAAVEALPEDGAMRYEIAATMLVHEFNNILMGVTTNAELIRHGKNVEGAAEQILKMVRHARRLTADVSSLTRTGTHAPIPLEVEPWFRDVALQARSLLRPDHALEIACEPGLWVTADPHQLQQVFSNLVLNARDAMPDGGTLTMEIRRDAPDARVHFVIRDTGAGISPQIRDRIFEPMFTTKPRGTGIGLWIVSTIIRRHRGEITVESAPAEGTTFHIFLPLVPPQ